MILASPSVLPSTAALNPRRIMQTKQSPARAPAFHSIAYAMIFTSHGRRGLFHFACCEAGHSNRMMATKGSLPLLRLSLLLITCLATPCDAMSATLDDAAAKLASEINAKLPAGVPFSCKFVNLSSISEVDAARLEQSLREAWRPGCAATNSSDAAGAEIAVTFSENWKEFVWTARIQMSTGVTVLVETSPRVPAGNSAPGAMPLALRAEKIWEGPQRILDFTAVKSPPDTQEHWLLTDEGVVLRLVGRTIVSQLQLSRSAPVSREPLGDLANQGPNIQADFSGKICTISPDTFSVTECHPAPSAGGAAAPAVNRNIRQRGNQSPFVEGACPFVRPTLASGSGDYTQRDFIQLFDGNSVTSDSNGNPVSAPLFFPGPVTGISGAEDLGIVVHNLDSGNYEAYRVYISCAK